MQYELMECERMSPVAAREYKRGYRASHNEFNPHKHKGVEWYAWNAGFVDYWRQSPKRENDLI